ncbi:LysR substrate-binding domain-containing protein [Paracoccus sp. S3-43]|uniref:LysR substrate-binding domain-containing protein n=1 Tax=Paracoccus sp. S3-43 TaxID=3030011 RepID=UPI0023B13D6D|nr:LysR substrate-binding domain-containing protein [Paracoccus sp. S3-43]WEF25591.1 LysR substrate-binding domain-containing protein [Paracoccus sp. S3-43]
MPTGDADLARRMTMARMPSLNALRAFVVSARHRSFGAAAAELHVSTAAIGQQVRLLEDHLGGPLFLRNRGVLEPTPLAQAILPGLDEAFQLMLGTLSGVARHTAPLRISVPPSFAMKWLMPRLDALHDAVPGLELAIEASVGLTGFGEDGADCAIRYGSGHYPGLQVHHLMSEAVLPVCSPDLAAAHDLAARGPAALAHDVVLLHETGPENDTSCPDWERWLTGHDVPPAETARSGIRLQQSSLALEAAAAGKGLALGKLRLAEADLASGRLVSPFGEPWPISAAYYFVAPDHALHDPAIADLLTWLRQEAGAVPAWSPAWSDAA